MYILQIVLVDKLYLGLTGLFAFWDCMLSSLPLRSHYHATKTREPKYMANIIGDAYSIAQQPPVKHACSRKKDAQQDNSLESWGVIPLGAS
jgi:hypothetical protein